MSMKFETNDRPDVGVQMSLLLNQTTFSNVIFPQNVEEPCENFQEVLASESFKNAIENIRKYNGNNFVVNQFSLLTLSTVFSKCYHEIINIEKNHYNELESLAVNLVLKEMGIPDNVFIFDVKIEKPNGSDLNNVQHNKKNSNNKTSNNENAEESNEILKRRIINSIIQGSSKRGHFMFHMVENEIKDIVGDNKIINLYGRMMSINDVLYWSLPDTIINSVSENNSYAGMTKIDRNTNPPTIYARGINFPVLVHEIIKGIMELFSVHGLPENYESFKDENETIENETWDLRLGPSIWRIIRSQFPEEIILDEDKKELQNYLLVEIFKLPANVFLEFIKEICEETDKGKKMINHLYNKITSLDDDYFE